MTGDCSANAPLADPSSDLPAITTIRTRVQVAGDDGVVIRFTNGVRLRFRETADGVVEAWVPPDDTGPTVTNAREENATAETLALRAVAEYLSFDGRRRAAFVWGERNLQALLGEDT